MRIHSLLLAFGMIVTTPQLTAMEVGGVDIPDNTLLQGSDQALVLNGAGIRKKFFMDIYAGALYLAAKSTDAAAITSDDGPAIVDMHIIYGEISKKKIVGGWNDGLQANLSQGELQSLDTRLQAFNALFTTVRKGDVIRIGYLPGSGTEVRINGESRGSVKGNDFFRALLKVWLGSKPVSKSLKKEMLGLD